MSSKLKTLLPGRRAVSLAGCVAVIGRACNVVALLAGIFVFLFVLATASAAAEENTVWTKYDNTKPGDTNTTSTAGRIPLGTSGQGDDKNAMHPAVIKDGSIYKMWYSGQNLPPNSRYRIYYATSTDGLIWTKHNNDVPDPSNTTGTDGRIPLGESGGDSLNVYHAAVIKDDSTYKMWYTGYDGTNYCIYHATSTDGLTWKKYTNAVPDDSNTTGTKGRIPVGTSGGDTAFAYLPAVILDDSTYKMWYTGYDGTNQRIYHATSPDGLTWTKYSNSVPDASNTTGTHGRIPLGETGGDTNQIVMPAVIKVRSTYKMWYAGRGAAGFRIYYATSTDGLTWTKCTNAVPDDSNMTSTYGRIPLGITGGDTNGVSSACVIKEGLIQEGYTYKMWYGGTGGGSRIYHATCKQPPVPCTIFIGH